MTIETKPEGSAVVAAVNGRLDGVTAEDFGKAMREVIQNGATRLVLDLGHVSYISSRGVGELVVAAKARRNLLCRQCPRKCFSGVADVRPGEHHPHPLHGCRRSRGRVKFGFFQYHAKQGCAYN
jgi:hypothetical protein